MIPRAVSELADGLAVVIGVVCVAAAVLAHGGRFSPRLDLLTHFAPVWLVGSLLVAAYSLARPELRLPLGGAGLLGALAAAALILPEYLRPIPAPAPAATQHQVKIVQYNAWRENPDIAGSVRWILAQQPDVVMIEELERPLREAMIATGEFHYTRGMLRTGIFTRVAPLRAPFRLGPPWNEWPGIAKVALPGSDGAPYTVTGVHLTWPTDWEQQRQIRRVTAALSQTETSRLILVGDFNLTPWSFTLQGLDRRLGLIRRDRAIFSWPAQPFAGGRIPTFAPFLPIDHVYAGAAWRTVSVVRGAKQGSDHYPLVITLALRD